jgi:tetratricopeptide (TPR) repeat protein
MTKISGKALLVLSVLLWGAALPAAAAPGDNDSIEELRAAALADPNNAERWEKLGKAHWAKKDLAAAASAYERVVALKPEDLAARKMLADFYSWSSQPEKSARELEHLLERDPGNLDLMEKLANRYVRLRQRAEAENLYRRILEKDPGNVKAHQGLAELSASSSRHEEAARRYQDVLQYAATNEQRIEAYDKVANSYFYAQDYGRSREYAREVLRLDPENEEALLRLKEIDEQLRPRVFNDFRHVLDKGGSKRLYNSAGFIQPTEYFTVTGAHKYFRRWEKDEVEDRYGYDGAHVELSKYFGEGLTAALGNTVKFYNDDKTRHDYYFRAVKDYAPGLRGDFLYEKSTEDGDRKRLEQRVDRHSLSATFYSDIADFLSFYWNLDGSYLTKGNAFSDNGQFSAFVRPVFHISKKPTLDFSYLYYRLYTLEKDRNPIEEFEYFAPRRYELHAIEIYFKHKISDQWTVAASDTVSWSDEGDDSFTKNTIMGELSYQFGKDRRIAARYIKGRHVHHADPEAYKDQEFRVFCAYKF